jgi:hypothetical protein
MALQDGASVAVLVLRYAFGQRFRVSARRAYAWCTDYRSDDHDLIGEKGRRRVSRLSKEILLLTDTWPLPRRGYIKKVKLVRLEPKDLAWTSTNLFGPTRYSQFLYRVVPEGRRASRIKISGVQVDRTPGRPTGARTASLTRRLCREDAAAWALFARAMEAELGS